MSRCPLPRQSPRHCGLPSTRVCRFNPQPEETAPLDILSSIPVATPIITDFQPANVTDLPTGQHDNERGQDIRSAAIVYRTGSRHMIFKTQHLIGSLLPLLACGEASTPSNSTAPGDIHSADSTGDNGDADNNDSQNADGSEKFDISAEEGSGNNKGDAPPTDAPAMIDLLFVIDNSGSTAEEQANLAFNLPVLVAQLENLKDGAGDDVEADVQILVTTTDMGHSSCEGKTSGQTMGRPVTTGCNERIDDFTDLAGEKSFADVCREVCPEDLVPEDDAPFIWFGPNGNNLPNVDDLDVNGDGLEDSPAAQSLACIGPQGVQGCGYESTLDAMLAALDPDAKHNEGDSPFLREHALLAIVVLTDEYDCSIDEDEHPEVFDETGDRTFWNMHPDFGNKRASSGICWNAGVECDGPNMKDEYVNCQSTDSPLVPVSRYIDFLHDMIEDDDKEIMMLGILGVPEVTEHDPEPPFLPLEGGVDDLKYRKWKDGAHPDGDILPNSPGVKIQEFLYSVGPGCTGGGEETGFTGQALPPVRTREVCESLDQPDKNRVRCCIESICDDDFSPAMRCLTGMIKGVVGPAE